MKFFPAVFLAFAAALQAQEVKFENGSFSDILAKAKKENKIVFLDAYASWCGPCKMMEKNVFTKPAVGDFYNTNFLNARFDMEKGEGPAIAAKYGITSYPSLLYLNGDGEIVKKALGYHEEAQFLEIGKDANSPVYKGSSLRQKFENGEKDPAFLRNLISLNASSDPAFAQRVADRYFELKKDAGISEEEIYLLLNFTKSSKSPNFAVLQKYRPEVLKKIPEKELSQFETTLKLNDIAQASVDIQKKEINDAAFLSEATKFASPAEAENYLNFLKLNFYPSVGNYEAFARTAVKYYQDGSAANPQEILAVAMVFAENVKDPAMLSTAVQWAEKSVMAGETSENTYVLAKLYYETGRKEMAKDFAATSRKLAESQGKNTGPILTLIKEIEK